MKTSLSEHTRTSIMLTNMYGGIGGGELAILRHAEYLKARKRKVTVLLLEEGPFVDRLQTAGIRVVIVPFQWGGGKLSSLNRILKTIHHIRLLIHELEAGLVVSYTFNDFVLAGLAARLAGCPVVFRTQGELFQAPCRPKTWLGPLLLPAIRYIRPLIVPTTRAEADNMRALGIESRSVPIRQVSLGADNITITNGHMEKAAAIRQELGWEGRPIVSIFGRLVEWKGHETIIRAVAILKQRGISVGLWIVGSADFGGGHRYISSLKELSRNLGVEEDIRYLGFRDDTVPLMLASDIICHASRFEPFGLVIIESMMLGRPVIASNVAGPKEIISDGRTGFLVEPGNAQAYADNIEHLIEDSHARQEMGARARAHAQQFYDHAKNIARLDELCEAYRVSATRRMKI